MYNIMALVTGLTIAVMITINGNLTQRYGAFLATVIVHMVGVLFAFILCVLQRRMVQRHETRTPRGPRWIYLGGVIGVLTTVFNNLSFGHISVTSIVALGLLGQTAASLVIDCRGLFGMERHPLRRDSFIGFAVSMAGIVVMLDHSVTSAVLAALLSFGSGITVVLSRTVNARLSQKIGGLESSFVNHLTGLAASVIIALIAARGLWPAAVIGSAPAPVWVYMGGMLGVLVVFLCNLTVPKVSSFRLTLLTFIGQVFTGIMLDCVSGNGYSDASFMGGLVIAGGVVVNLLLERYRPKGCCRLS